MQRGREEKQPMPELLPSAGNSELLDLGQPNTSYCRHLSRLENGKSLCSSRAVYVGGWVVMCVLASLCLSVTAFQNECEYKLLKKNKLKI